jgi:serpin B
VDQQYKLKPKFQNAAQAILNGQVANTDFSSGDKAATSLNEWVSVATNKQIPNLFVPGDFKTPSVLVGNALALKGVWEQSFDPAQTKPGPFRLTSGKTIQTPLMHSTANYRFADLGWVKVLEIPYQGGTLGLDLLLPPPKPDAMSKLERSVKELWFHDLTSHFSDRKLAVAIPKFEINCDLGETIAMLRAMGIQRVFNPAPTVSAEMAEIAEKPVLVSTWQHKTRITVDEKGTEALAAVAEAPNSSSTSIKPTEFIADHPFMFVVRHIPSNTVLFMGRLSKP